MSDIPGGSGERPPVMSGDRRRPAAGRPDLGGSRIEPGLLLGHTFIIEELLGRGGMGEVWRARHVELATEHAIKIILPELAENPKFVTLFKEEAKRLSRVRHDAVVSYDGLFRDEWGRQYLVMEFADGPSLSQVLERRRLSRPELSTLRRRLALGLAAAHERGIFHRDMSPDNVILPGERVENAKIIDFGIAKSADPADGTIVGPDFAGKYSFVSPEQAGQFGGRVDGRSDIYSLGLVLAAAGLGHGERLDMGNSPVSMIEARRGVPDLGRLPPEIRPLLSWMLQPNPDLRPQSVRDLVDPDVSHWVPAEPAAPAEPSEPPTRIMARPPAAWRVDPAPARVGAPGERILPVRSPLPRRRGRRRIMLPLAAGMAVVLAGVAGAYVFLRGTVDLPAIEARSQSLLAGADCSLTRATVASGSLGATVQVRGLVGSSADKARLSAALQGIPGVADVDFEAAAAAPLCPAARALAARILPQITSGPSIGFAGRRDATLRDGDLRFLPIAQAAGGYGFVYVDAFLPDGTVVHLLPNPARTNNLLLKGQEITVARTPAEPDVAGPPFGPMIVTVLSAPKLLVTLQRPVREPAVPYLEALAAALRGLAAQPDAARPTGTWRVFERVPG